MTTPTTGRVGTGVKVAGHRHEHSPSSQSQSSPHNHSQQLHQCQSQPSSQSSGQYTRGMGKRSALDPLDTALDDALTAFDSVNLSDSGKNVTFSYSGHVYTYPRYPSLYNDDYDTGESHIHQPDIRVSILVRKMQEYNVWEIEDLLNVYERTGGLDDELGRCLHTAAKAYSNYIAKM